MHIFILARFLVGRKLIVLTDQNFAPVLGMSENKCPVIIRVEGGWLSEIGMHL